MAEWKVIAGDCVEVMAAMDAGAVDAVVCDPPYGLEFMGKTWDRLGDDPHSRGGNHARIGDDKASAGGRHGVSYNPGPNPTCRTCGGLKYLATEGSGGRTKCRCVEPDFPNYKAAAGRAMQDWHEAWAREALRVLKPGGHLLAFGGTRTYHRLAAGIEDAGFEIRDTIAWMYGSGFPKSLDVSKAIDKAAGAEREVTGVDEARLARLGNQLDGSVSTGGQWEHGPRDVSITAPATPEAQAWEGWGTALKPAYEPIVVARKPLSGTVAATVLEHGTGALNIDGCRIGTTKDVPASVSRHAANDAGVYEGNRDGSWGNEQGGAGSGHDPNTGRWPANVMLDEDAARMLDEQTGEMRARGNTSPTKRAVLTEGWGNIGAGPDGSTDPGDSGGASRFFYCAKASSAERNAGLDGFAPVEREGQSAWAGLCNVCGCRMMLHGKPTCGHDDFEWVTGKATKNVHPTVKPIDVMRWLIRLVTPPGGLVLDPFTGSGTTGCAAVLERMRFVGIEREADYLPIAEARIAWWAEHPEGVELVRRLEREATRKAVAESGQESLFG